MQRNTFEETHRVQNLQSLGRLDFKVSTERRKNEKYLVFLLESTNTLLLVSAHLWEHFKEAKLCQIT